VRAVITTLLGEGYPEIETTAEILGLRGRTLQRHLAVRGVMYRGLVDQARFEAARNLLGRSEASITEIGYDLGYQDAAHFTRAFKRWAGVSPSVFRRTAAVPTSANGARATSDDSCSSISGGAEWPDKGASACQPQATVGPRGMERERPSRDG
jgi:AraC-like DNA-binding protein